MTNKQLAQMNAWLSGEERYKLLDPRRKAVLALPPSPFKLWMTYWMFESDEQEAYPSLETLERFTQMDRKTILKARKYLLATGWLVKLTGTAAERYSKPTRGSRAVAIYRVDDPTKGGEIPSLVKKSGNVTLPKLPPNGSGSVSVSSSGSASHSDPDSDGACVTDVAKDQKQNQNQKPSRVASEDKWLSKYDSPKPEGFDSVWSNVERTRWHMEHKRKVPVKPTEPPAEETPIRESAPPTPPTVPSLPPNGYHGNRVTDENGVEWEWDDDELDYVPKKSRDRRYL